MLRGTLIYMAPEQLRGQPADARCDQFAFAVALWRALYREHPFLVEGDAGPITPAVLRARISRGPSAPDMRGRPAVIEALLRRALEADPAKRWPSLRALLDALARVRYRAARRLRFTLAFAALSILGIASVAAFIRAGDAASCGARDQIASVWNAEIRKIYVSQQQSNAHSPIEAEWLDWYAAKLASSYPASCTTEDAARIACLDDAVKDLRLAVQRERRELWPRLPAIDLCGAATSERALGAISLAESVQLSSDGKTLIKQVRDQPPVIVGLAGDRLRALDVTRVVRTLPDGNVAGETRADAGAVAVIDPSDGRTMRVIRAGGRVIDLSPQVRYAAIATPDGTAVAEIDAQGSVGSPIYVSRTKDDVASFSADDRKLATVVVSEIGTGFAQLHVHDFGSKRREQHALRMPPGRTRRRSLDWLDARTLVVSGSGDLWRLRFDETGRLVEPPQTLRRGDASTELMLLDVKAGRFLAMRLRTDAILVTDGASTSTLPEGMLQLRLTAVDPSGRRGFGRVNGPGYRAGWVSFDDWRVSPFELPQQVFAPTLMGSKIVALDISLSTPEFVEVSETGTQGIGTPITAARGAKAHLRCGHAACLVVWSDGSGAFVAVADDHGVGAVQRYEPSDLAGKNPDWDISPDADRIAVGAEPPSSAWTLYSRGRSTTERLSSTACAVIDSFAFASNDEIEYACEARVPDAGETYLLVRRGLAPDSQEHIRLRTPDHIEWFLPIGDQRTVLRIHPTSGTLSLIEMR